MSKELEKSIWIVDDDIDDHELIKDMFADLKWTFPLELFTDAEQLLHRLNQAPMAPFIIISDVNLPRMDGFALREAMLKAQNNKFHSIPFIFWSTQASELQIRKAYKLQGHGFFRKEAKFDDWKKSLVKIIEYWTTSQVPSKEDKPDAPLT